MGQFEQALEKYAKYVIQQSRSNLARKEQNTSNKLYESLNYRIQNGRVKFLGEEYGLYQDKGVRGAEGHYADQATSGSPFKYRHHPSSDGEFVKSLSKWIKKKGIKGRDEKGRFIKDKTLSYLIARSIYKKGIRATMFFTKPFEEALPLFEDEILEGFLEDNLNLEE